MTDEDKHLVKALEDVQQSFGLEALPPEVLLDGMMATGENLEALAEHNVTLYSPVPTGDPTQNLDSASNLTQLFGLMKSGVDLPRLALAESFPSP